MNSKIPPLRRFVHAGSLYGGHRDLRPLIGALEMLSNGDGEARELVLAGPDSDVAAAKLEATPPVRITDLGHLSRTAAADLQRGADALVLATADTDFDASYTPAKLFEYAFRGKPIVATAREESDVAKLVRSHNLGVASLDPSTIASFIGEVERGEWGGPTELVELTSEFQFGRLADMIEERVCDQRRNGDEIGEDD